MGSLLCMDGKNAFEYTFSLRGSKETELWYVGEIKGKTVARTKGIVKIPRFREWNREILAKD